MAQNTKQVVIFRTGQMVEFDMVCNALKEAKIPYFTREETSGGLNFGLATIATGGPGVSWLVIVPEPAVEDASRILSELPVEIKTDAVDYWEFSSHPKVRQGWRVSTTIAVITALIILSIILFNFIKSL